MREIVFRVVSERPGLLVARAEDRPLTIEAPSLEELQHEAREALIEHLGSAHGTVRVRILRRHAPTLPARRRHGEGGFSAPLEGAPPLCARA